MKLSVKLLSGLSLIALVAVAVIGLSNSASAAVDGKVYITNSASLLTTEPSTAVAGRTSATTVYGTYNSYATTGTSARDIVPNSDKFIVTIVDADLNTTTIITSNQTSSPTAATGYPVKTAGTDVINVAGTGFDSPGDQVQITLGGTATNPIIGGVDSITIVDKGTDDVVSGVSVKNINFLGNGTNAPIITIGVDFGSGPTGLVDVVYSSSSINVITASVKSVVYPTGAVVALTETDRNSGRFEGYVWVKERSVAFTVGEDSGSGRHAEIPATGGPITVTYNDAVTSGTATNVARTGTLSIDITPPSATITSPTTASESQNRLPTFTGNVTDAQSGLDISTFGLYIDRNKADTGNTAMVIATGVTNSTIGSQGTVASIDLSAQSDGASTMAFSYTETTPLPDTATNPDNILDFQARQADLAGNYGYSDADAGSDVHTTGRHGNQPHTIKIDQVIPSISSVVTGKGWDASLATPAEDTDPVRDSIRVRFDGKLKDTSVSATDFKVVFSGVGGTYVPASIVVNGADVYLDLDTTIPSDNTPTITIQGTVQDLASNSTDSGSAVATDELPPVLTVTRSGGTGTGTGAEAADSLTSDKITVTVSSDEDLIGPPAYTVTDLNTTNLATDAGTFGVAQGGNVWALVVSKGTSLDGTRAIKIDADDTANNSAVSGDITTKAYTLDKSVFVPTSTPADSGTTTESNPFLTTDYSGGEASTVTITSATLDTVDVTSSLIASADNKTFFYQPETALTNASHTYVVTAKDAAGNTRITTTKFTKSDRTDFVLELFAGWNSVSVPSNPLDTDVNAVLSNSGVKQVVAYDATTPSQPWRIASKVGSAEYTSQTTPGLASITAGPGYWVETSDFEDQKVSLEGPTGPGDARPGLTTIATGNGWNLVGVVDQSRSQTQSGDKGDPLTRPNSVGTPQNVLNSAYFNTVNNGREYTFDTVTSKFNELIDGDSLAIGSGIWVFISPQDNGQLPHIVP